MRGFLFLVLFLIPNLLGALPNVRIQMIGDSLTVGTFGEDFFRTWQRLPQAPILFQSASWGSAPRDWSTKTKPFATIGTASREADQIVIHDPTKLTWLEQALIYMEWKSRKTYPTPKLSELVARNAPTHLIVALGANSAFSLQRGDSREADVRDGFSQFLREAKESGIQHVFWIGPPPIQVLPPARIAQLYEILRSFADPDFLTVIDSREWINGYPPASAGEYDDGIHYFHQAGQTLTHAWAMSAARRVFKLLKYRQEL